MAGGGYYYYSQGSNAAKKPVGQGQAKVEGAASKSAFTGGDQGFISLKLDSVETINHNTKKFRFALPEEDQVSGLKIASALLTKLQSPGMDKPVIRPYTPVSDEGMVKFGTLLDLADIVLYRRKRVF